MSIINKSARIFRRFVVKNSIQDQKVEQPVKLSFETFESKSEDASPPLLAMHGICGSKSTWNFIYKVLRENRKIIAVDARNHGDSEQSQEHTYQALATDVRAFLETQKIPQVAFLGPCMGGKVGMYLALQYPEIIERLIIVEVSPVTDKTKLSHLLKYFEAMLATKIPPNTKLSQARQDVNTALTPIIPDKMVRSFLLTNLVEKPNGTVDWRVNLKALIDNFKDMSGFPIEPESGIQYVGPTTFISGELSDRIPSTDHEKIKKLFPNAKFEVVVGAGHQMQSDKLKDFIQLIVEALNKPRQIVTT